MSSDNKNRYPLFIRIPKTASSSILHSGNVFKAGKIRDPDIIRDRINDIKQRNIHKAIYVNTMKYVDALDILDDTLGIINNNIYTYAFVRNPWDRAVSSWQYVPRSGKFKWDCTFKQFCHELMDMDITATHGKVRCGKTLHVCEQHPYVISSTRDLTVSYKGRFENLQADYDTICEQTGLPKQHIPHTNKTTREHYTNYYDSETRALIAEKYAKDIECFGYEYGE